MERVEVDRLIRRLQDAQHGLTRTVQQAASYETLSVKATDGFTVLDILRMWVWHFWTHHRDLIRARGDIEGDNPHFHVPHFVRQANEEFGRFIGELACFTDEDLDKPAVDGDRSVREIAEHVLDTLQSYLPGQISIIGQTGPAVFLRNVKDEDLPVFYEHQRDPDAVRMAAFTAKDPNDRDAFMDFFRSNLADNSNLIMTVELDGRVVGNVLSYVRSGETEVSYWIAKEFWGQGVATAALTAFLELQKTRPLHARSAKDNHASIRVLQKCGFVICGEDSGYSNARDGQVEEYIFILGGSVR